MQRQYLALKREVQPGAILMFRLGDFYEMFGEDAIVASPILGATLTQRNGQPMCGVPYHALSSYLAKLIRAGKTAALVDQVEDPKTAKGLVRREITRIVTPGTVTEDGLLDETVNTYIAACRNNSLAMLDLSTGEFFGEEFASKEALDEAMERYSPAETVREDESNQWTFSCDTALDTLTRHFKVMSLDGFGLSGSGRWCIFPLRRRRGRLDILRRLHTSPPARPREEDIRKARRRFPDGGCRHDPPSAANPLPRHRQASLPSRRP